MGNDMYRAYLEARQSEMGPALTRTRSLSAPGVREITHRDCKTKKKKRVKKKKIKKRVKKSKGSDKESPAPTLETDAASEPEIAPIDAAEWLANDQARHKQELRASLWSETSSQANVEEEPSAPQIDAAEWLAKDQARHKAEMRASLWSE